MSSSSPRRSAAEQIPDKLAVLLEMGFERVEAPPATTESVRTDADTYRVSQIRPAMGSFMAITVLHTSQGLAEEAIGFAFAEMDRLIGLLNRFDAASALSYLNDTGNIEGAPPELVEVVARGLGYHGISGGAFDITVKPLVDLFRDASTYEAVGNPSDRELEEMLAVVGPQHIDLRGRDIRFKRLGAGITLDGIGKGYIVDRIANTIVSQGVTRFLINAGGDIRTSGTRGGDKPWTIAVRDPDDLAPSWESAAWSNGDDPNGRFPDLIELVDGGVATSGSYEVYFDRERLSHHIVHGASGRSPACATSVTVTASNTMEADALATAVFVLGPQQGTRLIDARPGCECLTINRDGDRFYSRGWRGARGANAGNVADSL